MTILIPSFSVFISFSVSFSLPLSLSLSFSLANINITSAMKTLAKQFALKGQSSFIGNGDQRDIAVEDGEGRGG